MTRVGGVHPGGHKTRAENTAKVARRRANARAERSLQVAVPPLHRDFLIPQRDIGELLDEAGDDLIPIGALIAGVSDFKILRGSVASLNLTTSIQFAHLLTDASVIARGNVLVACLFQVPRRHVFGNDGYPEKDEDDAD